VNTLRDAFLRGLPELERKGAAREPALDEALEAALRRGKTRWPAVKIPPEVFMAHLALKVPPRGALPDALAKLHNEDLYLACACAQRDEQALAAFDQQCLPVVRSALARVPQLGADASELEQRLREHFFVGAAGRAPKLLDYAGTGSLKGWVRVTATRLVLNWVAREGREQPAEGEVLNVLAGEVPDPELSLVKNEYTREFNVVFPQAVAALERRDRALLRYRYVEGISIDKIGQIYGTSRATAARWVNEAQVRLMEKLRELLAVRLNISTEEVTRLVAVARSGLDVSLRRVLQSSQNETREQ
jgi:RNA polymerase sigma-70 factor (ECF subfamily)